MSSDKAFVFEAIVSRPVRWHFEEACAAFEIRKDSEYGLSTTRAST